MSRAPAAGRSSPSKSSTSSGHLKPRVTATPRATSPLKTSTAGSSTPKPATLRSKASVPRLRTTSTMSRDETPPPTPSKVNIRDVIAQRRAEAKKAPRLVMEDDQWNGGRGASPTTEEMDILGRASVSETIERAKRNGNLNLMSRQLNCLPKFLFESHLGLIPEPLALYTDSNADLDEKEVKSTIPSWQAQDLGTLKVADNLIVELQPELSLFGSLKHLDLKSNKLTSLPSTLGDLVNLNYLDVSKNALTSLPTNLSSLPELQTLLLADNELTMLDLSIPQTSQPTTPSHYDSFFAPTIKRAEVPLPKLIVLEVGNNKLTGGSVKGESLPKGLTKIELGGNPLGECEELLKAISRLRSLTRLGLVGCELTSTAFSFLSSAEEPFVKLQLLSLGECPITPSQVYSSFGKLSQTLELNAAEYETTSLGVLKIMLGKRVMKEGWEIEAEKRVRGSRSMKNLRSTDPFGDFDAPPVPSRSKAQVDTSEWDPIPPPAERKKPVEVVKEQWEIQAEQGLLTPGAQRLARAKAAAAAREAAVKEAETRVAASPTTNSFSSSDSFPFSASTSSTTASTSPSVSATEMSRSPSSSTLAAVLKPYYSIATLALVLPPILPRVQRGHNRAFSLATRPTTSGSAETSSNPLLPQSTLPLSIVVKQPWAATLKILELSNRRGELLFELPIGSLDAEATPPEGVLPMLDELKMDGCGLSDSVPVSFLDAEGKVEGSKASKPLFQTLSTLFPSLSNLDLSHNTITSLDSISTLLVPSWSLKRRGLKSLRLQGNKITSLEGLKDVWDQWKDGEKIDGWRLEELDVRDNEIGRLEGEVGLLPLEAFLVEGNTFRVPARRVWEREGTKGLLLWLRQRIEQ